MNFNINSPIVQDYALLIKFGEKNIDQVPNIGNLRDAVNELLNKDK